MKNVSTEFRKKVENGSACYAYANVVLRNGTKLTLDPSKDFRIDGNSHQWGKFIPPRCGAFKNNRA